MPSEGFCTLKTWLKVASQRLDIPMSNRQLKRATGVLIHELTEEQYQGLHADPTGETAIRNVMAWLQARAVGVGS